MLLPSDFVKQCAMVHCDSKHIDALAAIADEINRRVGRNVCCVKANIFYSGYDIKISLPYSEANHIAAKAAIAELDQEVSADVTAE